MKVNCSLGCLRTTPRVEQNTPPAEQNLWAKQISDHLSQSDNALDSALDSQLKILNLSMNGSETSRRFHLRREDIVPPEDSGKRSFLSLGPTLFFSGSEGNGGFLEKSYDSDRFSSIDLTEESVLSVEPSRLLQTSKRLRLPLFRHSVNRRERPFFPLIRQWEKPMSWKERVP